MGQGRDAQMTVVVRRISSGDEQSGGGTVSTVLRPSHSEPFIPVDGPTRPVTAAPARRRVDRDPSANPTPPLGRRSTSSSPADGGSSSGRTSSATRGPVRQRQPPPPLALPPPAARRRPDRADGESTSGQSARTARRGGQTDKRHRGTNAVVGSV